jgi:hypothetical protein
MKNFALVFSVALMVGAPLAASAKNCTIHVSGVHSSQTRVKVSLVYRDGAGKQQKPTYYMTTARGMITGFPSDATDFQFQGSASEGSHVCSGSQHFATTPGQVVLKLDCGDENRASVPGTP